MRRFLLFSFLPPPISRSAKEETHNGSGERRSLDRKGLFVNIVKSGRGRGRKEGGEGHNKRCGNGWLEATVFYRSTYGRRGARYGKVHLFSRRNNPGANDLTGSPIHAFQKPGEKMYCTSCIGQNKDDERTRANRFSKADNRKSPTWVAF